MSDCNSTPVEYPGENTSGDHSALEDLQNQRGQYRILVPETSGGYSHGIGHVQNQWQIHDKPTLSDDVSCGAQIEGASYDPQAVQSFVSAKDESLPSTTQFSQPFECTQAQPIAGYPNVSVRPIPTCNECVYSSETISRAGLSFGLQYPSAECPPEFTHPRITYHGPSSLLTGSYQSNTVDRSKAMTDIIPHEASGTILGADHNHRSTNSLGYSGSQFAAPLMTPISDFKPPYFFDGSFHYGGADQSQHTGILSEDRDIQAQHCQRNPLPSTGTALHNARSDYPLANRLAQPFCEQTLRPRRDLMTPRSQAQGRSKYRTAHVFRIPESEVAANIHLSSLRGSHGLHILFAGSGNENVDISTRSLSNPLVDASFSRGSSSTIQDGDYNIVDTPTLSEQGDQDAQDFGGSLHGSANLSNMRNVYGQDSEGASIAQPGIDEVYASGFGPSNEPESGSKPSLEPSSGFPKAKHHDSIRLSKRPRRCSRKSGKDDPDADFKPERRRKLKRLTIEQKAERAFKRKNGKVCVACKRKKVKVNSVSKNLKVCGC